MVVGYYKNLPEFPFDWFDAWPADHNRLYQLMFTNTFPLFWLYQQPGTIPMFARDGFVLYAREKGYTNFTGAMHTLSTEFMWSYLVEWVDLGQPFLMLFEYSEYYTDWHWTAVTGYKIQSGSRYALVHDPWGLPFQEVPWNNWDRTPVFIDPTSLEADVRFAQEKDSDDTVVLDMFIDQIVDPETGQPVTPNEGLTHYEAAAFADPDGIEILALRGVSPFSSPSQAQGAWPGEMVFTSEATSPFMPTSSQPVAKLVPRLIGPATTSYTMTLALYETVSDDALAGQSSDTMPIEKTFLRGDANKDGTVNVVDALFIAQYVVGNRTLSDINAVNAAGPRHDYDNPETPDVVEADRISIVDAMYIAQYKAFIRDANYNWLLDGFGGPAGQGAGLDSNAIVEVGGVQVPQNQSAPVPITVRSMTDPDGLGAYDFQVTFDPAIIRVDSVQPGQAPFDGVTSSIDNTNGVVLLTYFHTNAPGPTADIVVAYLNVTAIGNPWDVTDLDLTITTLSDTQGDDVPAWDWDGYVMVTP